MLALKERSEKDIAQQEVEMKELYRIIDHDNRLKEFMMFKACERTEFKEEEESKKKKCKTEDSTAVILNDVTLLDSTSIIQTIFVDES